MRKRTSLNRFEVPELARHVTLAWLTAVLTEYLILPGGLRDLSGLEGLARMSLVRVVLITCVLTVLLTGVSRFVRIGAAGRWGMMAVFALLAGAALRASAASGAFLAACLLILAGLAIFGVYGWDKSPEPARATERAGRAWVWVTAGLSAAFFLFVCAWTVGRVYSFSTPTYDFGIFSQMFYSMKKTGLPVTTLERDGPLSHFAVHVSPIYYLLLPFYCLAPTPAALQVLQAVVITSAVLPLWLIGREHGLTGGQRTLLCALCLLYPAFSGGTGYDIHENCFLTPLLLWLFYGIDRKNMALTAIAALLTLAVKEDAAVYVAVTALWLTVRSLLRFNKKDARELVTGLGMLAVSLGWFLAVTAYLAKKGDGVMTYRYENFMYGGSSTLMTVVKSVLMSPLKAVYECVDREKLTFIALTLLPLLGLPLLTRRYERYILLIPYILVNLMSDYRYQHDIFFQYTFGSAAFLMYLTAVNLADLRLGRRRVLALLGAAAVSAVCFGAEVVPTAMRYPELAKEYRAYYQSIRDALETVPEGASVTATTFYTTWLSQRETLYDVRYSSREHLLETEYVVLKLNADNEYKKYASKEAGGFDNLVELLEDNGYRPFTSLENVLVIYRREPAE